MALANGPFRFRTFVPQRKPARGQMTAREAAAYRGERCVCTPDPRVLPHKLNHHAFTGQTTKEARTLTGIMTLTCNGARAALAVRGSAAKKPHGVLRSPTSSSTTHYASLLACALREYG